MGRIAASVTIGNVITPEKSIRCDALVDTGASHLVLPSAWRERLGDLTELAKVVMETATQDEVEAIVCVPCKTRSRASVKFSVKLCRWK